MKAVGGLDNDIDHFLSESGWREFSNYLLYHRPALPHDNLQKKFNRFPWRDDVAALRRWQRGQTDYPIIDASMRELWQIGLSAPDGRSQSVTRTNAYVIPVDPLAAGRFLTLPQQKRRLR